MTERRKTKAGEPERAHDASDGSPAVPRQRRMSAKRKQEAVLRVLRGEDLELVSREIGTTAADLSAWRDRFLEAGAASLKGRPEDGRDRELKAMREKIGEMTMANELLEAKIDRMEAGAPFRLRRSKPLSAMLGIACRAMDEPDLVDLREAPLRSGTALSVLAPQPGNASPASGRGEPT